MTFEELLGLGVDDWERLSDEELTTILRPFFLVTRPTKESAAKAASGTVGKTSKNVGKVTFEKLQKELFNLATTAGIALPKK